LMFVCSEVGARAHQLWQRYRTRRRLTDSGRLDQ
jgi:hypothetical protein